MTRELSQTFRCRANAAPRICHCLLQIVKCVSARTLSIVISRLTVSSTFLLAPQIRLLLTIVCIYKLYLLTYLVYRLHRHLKRSVKQRRWHLSIHALDLSADESVPWTSPGMLRLYRSPSFTVRLLYTADHMNLADCRV